MNPTFDFHIITDTGVSGISLVVAQNEDAFTYRVRVVPTIWSRHHDIYEVSFVADILGRARGHCRQSLLWPLLNLTYTWAESRPSELRKCPQLSLGAKNEGFGSVSVFLMVGQDCIRSHEQIVRFYAPLYAWGPLYGVNLGMNRGMKCIFEHHNIRL